MAEPTLDNVMDALRKADQQGNEQDARRLAQIAKQMRQQQQPEQPQQPERTDRSFTDLSPAEIAQGSVETGLTMASGMIAEPIAGLFGTGSAVYDALRGKDNALSDAADTVEAVQQNLTFQPRSEAGMIIGELAGMPGRMIAEAGEAIATPAAEATGSPAVGAGIQTLVEGGPMGVLARPARAARRASERVRSERDVKRFARDEGIALGRRGARQREEIAEAGMRRADVERARSMSALAEATSTARGVAQRTADQLYENARASDAGVRVGDAVPFISVARQSLKNFDVQDMPKVRKRMRELQKLRRAQEDNTLSLNTIEKWRERINKNRSSDPAENAALNVLKAQADNYLEDLFVTDMIRGDPSALAKWQEARGAYRRLKETFDDDRVISQFARNEADPNEFRRFLFGASVVGAKAEASRTLRKLKRIIGEDSSQFRALRDDAMVDIMEPLMREDINLKGFVNNYDRFVRRNGDLARELFNEQQLGELKRLRDIAATSIKRGDPPEVPKIINRLMIPFMAGHGIAKGAARMSGLRTITDRLRETGNKRAFMAEMFNYDREAPLIPQTALAVGGAQQATERQSRQLERQRRLRGRQ